MVKYVVALLHYIDESYNSCCLFHNLSRRAKINRGYFQLSAWIGSRTLIVSDYSPSTWEREPAASRQGSRLTSKSKWVGEPD